MSESTQDTPAAGSDTAAAGDAAAAATAAAAGSTDTTPVVPETYEFTLPEGTLLDPKATERITEKAKALKVTDPALAQAMLDVADTEGRAIIAAYEAAHKEGGAAWEDAIKANEKAALAHPDLGNGDPTKLEAIALRGALVLNRYNPAAMQTLKAAGLLNEPSVLLLLKAVDEATREKASPDVGAVGAASVPWEKQWYPDGIKV